LASFRGMLEPGRQGRARCFIWVKNSNGGCAVPSNYSLFVLVI
jgi:hypothetical protein